jgi:superfamily II DNA/RNA helicase/HKD family nuclease
MSTKFFTNQDTNTLLEKFRGIFENNPDISQFDALVGYLRTSGYFAIHEHLTKLDKVRIIVGIDVDKLLADYTKRGLLFTPNESSILEEVDKQFKEDIQSSKYNGEIESGILKFIEDVASGKVQLRAHPKRKLHAKVYVFLPKGFNQHKPGAVITGSSNLTAAGIGAEDQETNYEFNILMHDYEDVVFAESEFERLWNESINVLPETILDLKKKTYLGVNLSPYELYYKLLIEYFGTTIEYDPNSISDMPSGFKRLSYQADAVSSGYRLLEKHNGFFLADVVGLGKTVVATLIAKKFFFKNGFPEHRSRTLIICPPHIEENWTDTTERFKLDNVTVLSLGKLSSMKKPEKFDLVIVDEAHRFRNDVTGQFNDLQRICKSPTERLGNDDLPTPKKIILVSATPLNNAPSDLRSLISLFQDMRDSTLAVNNLQSFFNDKDRRYKDAKKLPRGSSLFAVKDIYSEIREKVLSEIIVRRTRTDLIGNEEYKKDLDEQGIKFPKINPPKPIYYALSPVLDHLYDQTVRTLSGKDLDSPLLFTRYRALSYLKQEHKSDLPIADLASEQLSMIMRTGLIKRLDSSFYAFKKTLERFKVATQIMVDSYNRGVVYLSSDVDVIKLIAEGDEDKILEMLSDPENEKIKQFPSDYFSDSFLEHLEGDLDTLKELWGSWSKIDDDPKLEEFLKQLKNNFFDPKINHAGNKLVVFSESTETIEYLHKAIVDKGYTKTLLVHGGNRKEQMQKIISNFDANQNIKDQKNDFEIILTTQVLAEGINLHRSNVIVNYDTPWNSILLMQRIGRVNRIGSVADSINIFNFYPASQVDDLIELKKKAIMKLQAFHSALGEDSQIYSDEEEVETFGLFERNLEETERDERLSLLLELRKFRAQNPQGYRKIKSLPLRARIGRKNPAKSLSTVSYIKSNKRDGFYRINANRSHEELTIVEVANEFRPTSENEQSISLHKLHHEQVNQSIALFKEISSENESEVFNAPSKLPPTDSRAMAFIKAISKLDIVNEDDLEALNSAERAIQVGAYQKLPRDINKFKIHCEKSKLSNVEILDGTLAILSEFHLINRATKKSSLANEYLPEIILSESFDE